jgi:NAD(P)-dependent dehydrogenase (short-subunit alcohol dehydrogenase family)
LVDFRRKKGIGHELARREASRGDHVTASVRNEEAPAQLAAKLAPLNANVATLVFDAPADRRLRIDCTLQFVFCGSAMAWIEIRRNVYHGGVFSV